VPLPPSWLPLLVILLEAPNLNFKSLSLNSQIREIFFKFCDCQASGRKKGDRQGRHFWRFRRHQNKSRHSLISAEGNKLNCAANQRHCTALKQRKTIGIVRYEKKLWFWLGRTATLDFCDCWPAPGSRLVMGNFQAGTFKRSLKQRFHLKNYANWGLVTNGENLVKVVNKSLHPAKSAIFVLVLPQDGTGSPAHQ